MKWWFGRVSVVLYLVVGCYMFVVCCVLDCCFEVFDLVDGVVEVVMWLLCWCLV